MNATLKHYQVTLSNFCFLNDLCYSQDSNWSSRANRLVTEWLKNEDLRYLGVKHDKTNDDGTVYGDVFRKLRSRAFACTNENENTPESEGNEKKSEDKLKTKEKFYLSEYILSMHFGMRNEDLTCSQLKIRVTPSGTPKVTDVSANTKAGSSCTSLTTPTSMSKAAPATPTPPQTEEIGPENMALCQDFKPAVVQDDAYCGKDKQGMLLQSFNAMVDEAVVDEEKELAYAKNDSDDDFDFADGFDFRMQLDDMLQSIGMTKTQVVDKFRELNHNAGFAALPLTPPSLQIAPPQPVIQKIPPQPIIQKIPPQPIIQKTPPQPIILKAPPPPQPTQPQLIFLKAPPQPVIQKTPPQPTIQDTSPKPSTSAAFSKPSPEKYQLTVSSIWRQTDQSFILTIQLPDIKKYELKVLEDKNNVEFRTMDKTPNYGFKIKLFGKVDQEYSTHLTGQYMRVTFTKRMVGHKWPRALHDRNEKLKWLKQDIEQSFEDEEENAELNERMKLLEVSAAANALADDEYDVDQGMMLFSASESEAEEDF